MENSEVYEAPDVVDYYRNIGGLQEAEKSILAVLSDDLSDVRMLDIGVGAGRTTEVFAPLVAEYVGVDFARAMVDACRTRFGGSHPHWSFEVADARSLNAFEDNSFDFVLFSFNGIDGVGPEDRLRIFEEVKRVLEPGGTFAFSTHNLNSPFESRFSVRRASSVMAALRLFVLGLKFRMVNPRLSVARRGDHALIRDGTGSFRAVHYFIKPKAQRQQLVASGFQDIRVFGHSEGEELEGDREANAVDPWLYYLCSAPDSQGKPDRP